MLRQLFCFTIQHLRRRRRLSAQLERALQTGVLHFTPKFSGRVAIHDIARQILEQGAGPVAWIPDYICNVVPLALERAGFQVAIYETDRYLEPDASQLSRIVTDPKCGLLLLSSIYGSSAGLDLVRSVAFRQQVQKHRVHILVDICQDITLRHLLPQDYGPHLSATVSFNHKSFPGAMGGGILSTMEPIDTEQPITSAQSRELYSRLAQRMAGGWRRRLTRRSRDAPANRTAPEYAACQNFPFGFTNHRLTRLQIIMALQGLRNLPHYYQRRKQRIARLNHVQPMRHHLGSPLLILNRIESSEAHRIKPPYARHHSPHQTLRSDLTVVHNNGFDD
ncbi:MAG: hypothetical protein ABGZ17_28695 [Planctomycetaceae bacterium]